MKQKIIYTLIMGFCMLNTVVVSAQDEPDPPPPAPINRYVLLVAFIAAVYAWQVLEKKTRNREISK